MSKDKISNLNVVTSSIEKEFGPVVKWLADASDFQAETISTGCIGLDLAIGNGGLERGLIAEFFGGPGAGKSFLGYSIIREACRKGYRCFIVDAEHSIDPKLLVRLGLPEDKVLVVDGAPTGEDNLDIAHRLMETGEFAVGMVDSVAALVPTARVEQDYDQQTMGLHARLMSAGLQKISTVVKKTNTLLIFINQLRNKIGEYGCFHYDTLVNFTDGRSIPIGEIVDNKIEGKVWSIDEHTGGMVESPIVAWHDNGTISNKNDFLHVQTSSIDGKGRFGFTCTPNHKVLTAAGWKEAQRLSLGDKLISKYLNTVNGTYGKFLKGILIGDSHLSARHRNTAALKLQDNENQQYLQWKIEKLSPFINFKKTTVSQGFRYDSPYTYEFMKIKKNLNSRDPMFMLDDYSDIGLALWVMDDGHLDLEKGHCRYSISMKRFKNNVDKLEQVANKLEELNLPCAYKLTTGTIIFDANTSKNIASRICSYVPGCMGYKLPQDFRNKYVDFVLTNEKRFEPDLVEIVELRTASARQKRNRRKFDISIEGAHNYMVGGYRNGVIVHNSPETTTGGNALPFYASYRISLRGGTFKSSRLVDEGTGEVYGHRTTFEVVKNKRSAPYRKAEVDLIYGLGYDNVGEVVDLAADVGVLEKNSSWFIYGDMKWQGRDKVKLALMGDEALLSEIEKKIRGITSPEEAPIPATEEEVDDKSVSQKRKRDAKGSVSQ